MKLILATITICLLMSGCASPSPSSTDENVEPTSSTQENNRELNGIVSNIGAYACLPNGATPFVGNYHTWTEFKVNRPADATHATINLEWAPVNPTMDSLQVGISHASSQTISPDLVLGPGKAPWVLELDAELLNQFEDSFKLAVYAGKSCVTNPGIGAHLSWDELENEQPFTGSLTWHE